MKLINQYKILTTIIILFLTTSTITNSTTENIIYKFDLLYDNIWGTIYNPESNQCDDTPNVTADGSYINGHNASDLRWVAISQEMLNCDYRSNIVGKNDIRFKGKISFGDTIYIISNHHPKLNGWWVVHDTKHAKLRKSIDFLQSTGDNSLFDKFWSGKFNNLKIYKLKKNYYYSDLTLNN